MNERRVENTFPGRSTIIQFFLKTHLKSLEKLYAGPSLSEKLRSNGYVGQDNQVHFISVEMTPGFAIISQTILILQQKWLFSKIPK